MFPVPPPGKYQSGDRYIVQRPSSHGHIPHCEVVHLQTGVAVTDTSVGLIESQTGSVGFDAGRKKGQIPQNVEWGAGRRQI